MAVGYSEEVRVVLNRNENTNNSIILTDDILYDILYKFNDIISNDEYFEAKHNDMDVDVMQVSGTLGIESIFFNNIISSLNYKNVLVIPSFKNSKYEYLTDEYYISHGDICAQAFATINKFFNCSPNVFVAYPPTHDSLMKNLLREFKVHVINSNKMYVMGDESYEINVPEGLKFDAVLLVGIDINEGETFQVSDIKNDFSSYCTTEFDLIDFFADDENVKLRARKGLEMGEEKTRLVGENKSIDDIIHFINTNTVKTTKIYEDNGVLSFLSKTLKRTIKVY